MESPVRKKIPVTKLRLDQKNPRYPPTNSQDEAFEQMIRLKGREIYRMAKDIVKNGLNPSVTTIVYLNPEGEHIVKDGNRRATALKALNNPKKIRGENRTNYRVQFEKLGTDLGSIVNSVPCVIYRNENDADHWVEHNHSGGKGGIGKLDWDSEQGKRYAVYRTGVADPTIELYDAVISRMENFENLKKSPPITTVERIINFVPVREELGFDIKDRKIVLNVDREDFVRDWIFIFTHLGNETIRVDDVKTKDKTLALITKWRLEAKERGESLFSSKRLESPTPFTKKVEPVSSSVLKPPVAKPPVASIITTNKRKTLIPRHCDMDIEQTRINNIYDELKNINLDRGINAAAISLRVFLELSVEYYFGKHSREITLSEGKRAYLHHRMLKVAEHLKNAGKIDDNIEKALKKACTMDPINLELTTELHQYVHNYHLNPDMKSLKTMWDNIESFVKAIWEK